MQFKHSTRQNPSDLQILLNGKTVEKVSFFKLLGVTVSETLHWNHHITEKCNKIAKVVAIMSRIKHEVPSDILLSIYQSLITPHINYGIIAWGDSNNKQISRLEKLQKKAIRTVFKANYKSHTGPLFLKTETLPIRDHFKYRCCTMYLKVLENKLPPHFCAELPTNEAIHDYQTRSQKEIHINNIQTNLETTLLIIKLVPVGTISLLS